jgi:hypothetical protein
VRIATRFGAAVTALVLGSAAAGFVQPESGQQGAAPTGVLGIFEGQTDIDIVRPAGSASFDTKSGVYSIISSGANLWSTTDGFHLVWRKMTGDLSLTADIELAPPGGGSNPHRKALLMFRQTLDPDSMYADVAVHGSGETALQYRRSQKRRTRVVELPRLQGIRILVEPLYCSYTAITSSS